MAIVAVRERLFSFPPWVQDYPSGVTSLVLDLTGEYGTACGSLELELGATGSKTLSPGGGGAVVARFSGASTFADAGSSLDVGVGTIASTGYPTSPMSVYGRLIGGTDTIPTNAHKAVPMTSGTITLAEGDELAITAFFTARAGSDVVNMRRSQQMVFSGQTNPPGMTWPYGAQNVTAGGLQKYASPILVYIRFDDGTVGWVRDAHPPLSGAQSLFTFSSGSSPNQYCGSFIPAVDIQIDGMGAYITAILTPDTFSQSLVQDPFGSPTDIVGPTARDPLKIGTSTPGLTSLRFSPITLTAGVEYGINTIPTSANSISLSYHDLTSSFADMKKLYPLGAVRQGSRTTSGAFTETATYHMPLFWVDVCGREGGGGGVPFPSCSNPIIIVPGGHAQY